MFGGLCEALWSFRPLYLFECLHLKKKSKTKIVYPLDCCCVLPHPKSPKKRTPKNHVVPNPHFLPANWVIHQVPLGPLVGWVRWLVRLAVSARLAAIPMVQLGKVEHFPHDCYAWWKLFPWSSLGASPATTNSRWVESKGGLEIRCVYYII